VSSRSQPWEVLVGQRPSNARIVPRQPWRPQDRAGLPCLNGAIPTSFEFVVPVCQRLAETLAQPIKQRLQRKLQISELNMRRASPMLIAHATNFPISVVIDARAVATQKNSSTRSKLQRAHRCATLFDPLCALVSPICSPEPTDTAAAEKEVVAACDWIKKVRIIAIELHDRTRPGCRSVVEPAAIGFHSDQRCEVTFFAR
jgi:hypothetical protein